MDRKAILKSLCQYDHRNPDFDPDMEPPEDRDKKGCFCDNCFNGRAKLANEILLFEHNSVTVTDLCRDYLVSDTMIISGDGAHKLVNHTTESYESGYEIVRRIALAKNHREDIQQAINNMEGILLDPQRRAL